MLCLRSVLCRIWKKCLHKLKNPIQSETRKVSFSQAFFSTWECISHVPACLSYRPVRQAVWKTVHEPLCCLFLRVAENSGGDEGQVPGGH